MVDKKKFENDDESGDARGGQGGVVEFRDFLTPSDTRDDLLSGEEKRIKLNEHNYAHENRVKQQKDKRDQRNDLRNGKIPLEAYRAQQSGASQYKANPILANAAQFSGKDPQTNTLPNELIETNRAEQDELKLRLGQRFENTPKFNPRPHFP